MGVFRHIGALLLCSLFAYTVNLGLAAKNATAQTFNRIAETGSLRIGISEYSPPFSYLDQEGRAKGLAVQICLLIAKELEETDYPDLKANLTPVAAELRFSAIEDGLLDMMCGATTITLSRRAMVDFSLPFFIDGASMMTRDQTINRLTDLAGRSVVVVGATTTEATLRGQLEAGGVETKVATATNHDQALTMLQSGAVDAYFGDRGILQFMQMSSGDDTLRLSNSYLTHETYGIALPKGDDEFRLRVDRVLSDLFRSGKIDELLKETFGPTVVMSDVLKYLYVINALPE